MPLSDFAKLFRLENAEIIAANETVARISVSSDFFHAYRSLRDELYSVTVQYSMMPYYELRTREFHENQLSLIPACAEEAALKSGNAFSSTRAKIGE